MKEVIIILILSIIGFLLLASSYCLPIDKITTNIKYSRHTFSHENGYEEISYSNSKLDNYTDGLMVLEAGYDGGESPIIKACNSSYRGVFPLIPNESLVEIYKNENTDIDSIENIYTENYARYWHGYLIFLKPLLCLFTYPQIRNILAFIELGLIVFLVYRLTITNHSVLIIPLFVTVVFMSYAAIINSLQYSSVFIITLLSMAIILRYYEKKSSINNIEMLFCIIGCLTSYFDLLTYPMVTLGLPLGFWFFLNRNTDMNIKDWMIVIAKFSFSWLLGYGLMWANKWIISSVITGKNIIENAMKAVQLRTSSVLESINFTYIDIIKQQIQSSSQFWDWQWLLLICVFVIMFIFCFVFKKSFNWQQKIIVLLLISMPFVWYLVLSNHSYEHPLFTYRELSIAVFAMTSFITISMLNKKS